MEGVGLKLCAVILILHVSRSTELDVQQFLANKVGETLLQVIPIGQKIHHKLRERVDKVVNDFGYNENNNDLKDQTRKKRMTYDLLIPNNNKIKTNYLNEKLHVPYELEYNKNGPSQIWRDRLENLIHHNFVPHKKCHDHESGKLTNYYKAFDINWPTESSNSNIEKMVFKSINDRHTFEPFSRQHDTNSDGLQLQTETETASGGIADQIGIFDSAVVPIEPDTYPIDTPSGTMSHSVSLVKDQSNTSLITDNIPPHEVTDSVSLVNEQPNTSLYSIGDMPQVTDTTDAKETDTKMQFNGSNSMSISSDIQPSECNTDLEHENSHVFSDNQIKTKPSVPKFDYSTIWAKNNPPHVIMTTSSYPDYIPNKLYPSSYHTHDPFIYNDKVFDNKDYAFTGIHGYYGNPHLDGKFTISAPPLRPDKYGPSYNWYNYKHYDYQPYYNKYNSFDKQSPQVNYTNKINSYLSSQMFFRPTKVPQQYFGPNVDKYRSYLPKVKNGPKFSKVTPKEKTMIMRNDINKKRDRYNDNYPQPDIYSYLSPGHQIRPIRKAECGEGTSWVRNCNRCFCSDSGAVCEEIQDCKLKPFGEPMLCKPYSTFKLDDCYVCECNGDGVPECSIQDCKQDIEKISQQETYNQFYDSPAAKRLSNFNVYQKLSNDCPPRNRLPTCEQGTVWRSSCYECTCNEDGRRECVQLINCRLNRNEYGKPAKCKPNSTFSPGVTIPCQLCECDDEGEPYCPMSPFVNKANEI